MSRQPLICNKFGQVQQNKQHCVWIEPFHKSNYGHFQIWSIHFTDADYHFNNKTENILPKTWKNIYPNLSRMQLEK